MEKSAVKAAKPRDYSFDNIKAILILCVVLGFCADLSKIKII